MFAYSAYAVLWVVFAGMYVPALVVDIWRNRNPHTVGMREAAVESAFWIGLALSLNGVVFVLLGAKSGFEFLSAFIVEKALSVDNLFIFLLIFSAFEVPEGARKRVLLWGVLGAVILRGVMILAGVKLVEEFHFLEYLFGAVLIWSSVRIAKEIGKEGEAEENISEGRLAILLQKYLPYQDQYMTNKFFVYIGRKRVFTKLFFVLCLIEGTDVIFAVDSIPAVVALTHDPFVAFASNICAIMGLRALYFLLANVIEKMYYIKHALVSILFFIGLKMLLSFPHWLDSVFQLAVELPKWEIGIIPSLGFIAVTLTAATIASMRRNRLLADFALLVGEDDINAVTMK